MPLRTLRTLLLPLTLPSLLPLTFASNLVANNLCPGPVWLTLVDGSGNVTDSSPLAAGEGFLETIAGQGKSLGVTRSDSYGSSDTPKLIVGTTEENGVVYWSVSTVDGDPFATEGIDVTSPDASGENVCGMATYGDRVVHGCRDGAFALTVALCSG